jgi:D-xylose transport system permease protein
MATQNPPAAPENALLASQSSKTVGEYMAAYFQRLRAGDLGTLPIVFGLIVIAIIFQSQNANFLTPNNFVNLILQVAGYATIAYGVVFVLLLGEIDLSVGSVSGVVAVATALLVRPPFNMSGLIAIPLALIGALAIGFLHGRVITLFQLPSFIVTLAGLLAWNGLMLNIIGPGGNVTISEPIVRGIATTFLPNPVYASVYSEQYGALIGTLFANLSWILGALLVGFIAFNRIVGVRTRRAKGLSITPMPIIIGQIIGLAVLTAIVIAVCNQDVRFTNAGEVRSARGVPLVGILLLFMLAGLSFLADRTQFGRFVFAVGGNKEAARRAGINVERIRIYVFMICSMMAGAGGIIFASRLGSVDPGAGGGNILLYAIASAVIGGTSLFGGSGKVSSAVLGALVIAAVDNGMGLLSLPSGTKFIITGLVLLAAVIVDALSRRRQTKSGIV